LSDAALVVIVAIALAFDFTNGFHDTANAVATSVSTRALSPRIAVLIAAIMNFVGAFSSTKVAKTVGGGLINTSPGFVTAHLLFAALAGAIIWNLITWRLGLPSSSTHALIGGLLGAALARGGQNPVDWSNLWHKTIVPGIASPIIGWFLDFYRNATDGKRNAFIFTGPIDAFATRIKVATYGGIVLALPIWLWQMWRFITPALDPKEKRYAVPFVLSAIVLFALGAFVAFLTLEPALNFLLNIGGSAQRPLLTYDKYLTLVALMVVAFGLSFEFPIVLVFLLIARIITTAQLRHARRWAAVGIVAFAAVITPSQDPYSLFFMAVPMYVFYEASIIIGRILKR